MPILSFEETDSTKTEVSIPKSWSQKLGEVGCKKNRRLAENKYEMRKKKKKLKMNKKKNIQAISQMINY